MPEATSTTPQLLAAWTCVVEATKRAPLTEDERIAVVQARLLVGNELERLSKLEDDTKDKAPNANS